MTSKPFLSLRNVGVQFQRAGRQSKQRYFTALSDINLDVYAGEVLGVLGVNGAGKSTLLKVLSGVLRPDTGRVENNGASVALLALKAGFDQNLSGRDNAIFGGMLLGYTRAQAIAQLEAINAYAELGEHFHEPVKHYSSGMASRLGFAISTVMNPDVLLVDEVLSVGDAHFKAKAKKTMMQKIAMGKASVLVSHSRNQVATLCDRCVILHQGQLIEGQSVEAVLSRYDALIASR